VKSLHLIGLIGALHVGVALADAQDTSSKAFDLMRRYARCTVPNYPREALKLVTSSVDARDFDQLLPRIVIKDAIAVLPLCQPPLILPATFKITFAGEPLRFALAEALIERDWRSTGPTDFADVPALPSQPVQPREAFDAGQAKLSSRTRKAALQAEYDQSVATAWLFRFGECVVRRDGGNAKAWTLSVPNSAAETSFIRALNPSFGACLPDGKALTFNRLLLRGAMAVNYVRLAEANRLNIRALH
jgi:hypothetical protein